MPSIIIGEKDIRQSGSKLAGLFILFSFSSIELLILIFSLHAANYSFFLRLIHNWSLKNKYSFCSDPFLELIMFCLHFCIFVFFCAATTIIPKPFFLSFCPINWRRRQRWVDELLNSLLNSSKAGIKKCAKIAYSEKVEFLLLLQLAKITTTTTTLKKATKWRKRKNEQQTNTFLQSYFCTKQREKS